jgi:hypothetical protein
MKGHFDTGVADYGRGKHGNDGDIVLCVEGQVN